MKEDIKKKFKELSEKIKSTEEELKSLRDSCGHSEHEVKIKKQKKDLFN